MVSVPDVVCRMVAQKKSIRFIAETLGISATSVWRMKQGASEQKRPRPKTDAKKERARRWKVIQGLMKKKNGRGTALYSSCELLSRAARSADDDIGSASTVRRLFLEHGWRSRVRRRLPLQKPTDHIYRKEFCWKYRAGSKTILFSDEKNFDTHDCGSKRAWCGPGELAPPLPRQQFPPSVMVWGVIGVGFRHLEVLPKQVAKKGGGPPKAYRMNAEDYAKKCLGKVIGRLRRPDALFMQDGAKCHTAASTTKYLRDKGVNFIEKWPPRSPQLNPIENMWATVARAVSDRGPVDSEQLATFVKQEFYKIPERKVDELVLSWKGRLKRCHAADGHLW